MLIKSRLSNIFAAFVPGRSSPGASELQLQTTDRTAFDEGASSHQEQPLNLSPAGCLLLAAAVSAVAW